MGSWSFVSLWSAVTGVASLAAVLPALLIGKALGKLKYYLVSVLCLLPGDEISDTYDRLFFDESAHRIRILFCAELEGEVTEEEVQWLMQQRLIERSHTVNKLSKLRSIPVCRHGIMFWKRDANFNLSKHIRVHPSLARDESSLWSILAEYVNPAVTGDKSPWEVVLIPSERGTTHVLLNAHHSIADGVSGLELFKLLFFDSTEVPTKLRPHICSESLVDLLKYRSKYPSQLLKRMVAKRAPDQLFPCVHVNRTAVVRWSAPIQLSDIQLVRGAVPGATLNDVVCGLVIHSLIEYMKAENIAAGKAHLDVEVTAAITSRKSNPELGTKTGRLEFHHPITNRPILEHISLFSQASLEQKRSLAPGRFRRSRLDLVDALSVNQCALSYAYSNYFAATSDLLVINIPGPVSAMTVMGRKVKDMVYLPPPRSPAGGITVGLISYDWRMRLALNDRFGSVTAAQAERLLDMVTRNFHQLVEEVREEKTTP